MSNLCDLEQISVNEPSGAISSVYKILMSPNKKLRVPVKIITSHNKRNEIIYFASILRTLFV
jgi:hypothetical protein